jgi:hypothetical protein
MQCERCNSGAEAAFRVRTDILDMLVCEACANQARRIGIPVVSTGRQHEKKRLLSLLSRGGKLRVSPRPVHAR